MGGSSWFARRSNGSQGVFHHRHRQARRQSRSAERSGNGTDQDDARRKFDIDGNRMDLPTKEGLKKSSFRPPSRRADLCLRKSRPPVPLLEVLTLPPDHVSHPNIMIEEVNRPRNREGDLDSCISTGNTGGSSKNSREPEKGIRGFWGLEAPRPPGGHVGRRGDVIPARLCIDRCPFAMGD
jgi:hypothetical protein